MKLTDFELDLPYVENERFVSSILDSCSCNRSEATRVDYQNNWKEKRRKFALETRCMTAFFARVFSGYSTRDCRKILVECVPNTTHESIMNFSGIYEVQVQFDYNSFSALDILEKKKQALELLMSGIRSVALNQNWDMVPFNNAYNMILEANYVNEWTWGKGVKNFESRSTARVLLLHEVSQIDIYLVVHDKYGTEVSRGKVISELPDEYAYAAHLGKIEWIDTHKVALVSKNNDKKWVFSF